METASFFKNIDYKLFGVLHVPDIKSKLFLESRKLGIVFCHPFAEEKLFSHRILLNLARTLTRLGIYCLRFDYMGHGDSEGNFEDSSLFTRIGDIKCAVNFLKKNTGVEAIGIVGVRLGASLAVLASTEISVDFMILISPIIKGKNYIDQCLRSNLTMQMSAYKRILKSREELIKDLQSGQRVNIDGYLVTKALYNEITGINLIENTATNSNQIYLVNISKSNKPDSSTQLYIEKLKSQKFNVLTENINMPYFWKNGLNYDPIGFDLQKVVKNCLNEIISKK